MRSFASDNNSGVHPLVMEALTKANIGHAVGYGDDSWTEEATEMVKKQFARPCEALFVFNGTGSNTMALQLMTRPYHIIFVLTPVTSQWMNVVHQAREPVVSCIPFRPQMGS